MISTQRIRIEELKEYAKIPISFEVNSIFKIFDKIDDSINLSFVEKPVKPWIKNYDGIDSERPLNWSKKFDMQNWGIFGSYKNGNLIGGATVAFNTPNVNRLEGRKDITALWDIRIRPEFRRKSVGRELFLKAIQFTQENDCRCMKVETQNINVGACRFYSRMGCTLGAINRYAYWDFPNEIMMDWYYHIDKREDAPINE